MYSAIAQRIKNRISGHPPEQDFKNRPVIMGGQACIRGMRIPVSLVLNLVANGMSTAEILIEYPDLEPENIQRSLKYAAWLANERIYGFPAPTAS